MVSIASLLGARHLWEVVENKPASSLDVSLGPTFMWKTGDPEIATPKRVRTYRPKQSDTSLSREWRINMANTPFFLDFSVLLTWSAFSYKTQRKLGCRNNGLYFFFLVDL